MSNRSSNSIMNSQSSHSSNNPKIDLSFPHDLLKIEAKDQTIIKNYQRPKGVLETDLDEILVDDGAKNTTRISYPQISKSFLNQNLILPVPEPSASIYENITRLDDGLSEDEVDDDVSLPLELSSNETRQESEKLNISSVIISYVVISSFVCLLWLVVFTVFGFRGHTIAGVFVALFFVALLINTCFLKCYFRLRTLLGLSGALALSEKRAKFLRQQQKMKARMASQKSRKNPPSYTSVVAAPPRYSFLQFYKSKKSFMSLNSSAIFGNGQCKQYKCPFCRREVLIFGICKSCRSSIQKR